MRNETRNEETEGTIQILTEGGRSKPGGKCRHAKVLCLDCQKKYDLTNGEELNVSPFRKRFVDSVGYGLALMMLGTAGMVCAALGTAAWRYLSRGHL